ncbi:MAG: Flp pilus assembly complex ATPase component TadA [Candidatus Cloacimonetes bacterium]|nr:Flp pilus assembly complex ATPase component TadA [Candidatus Cloacimonadota bacterium]
MALSFKEELHKLVPENFRSEDQIPLLDKWLTDHPDQAREARETLYAWLQRMRELNASDVDFGAPGANKIVWMRLYGSKKPYPEFGEYSELEYTCIILSWLSPKQRLGLISDKSQDFSLSFAVEDREARFRGTAYFDRGSLAANFRRINDKIYSMESLRIPKPIEERMNLKTEKIGLVLITGITGSGKSTTLDAIIDLNNRENNAHIVIIGHPIEHIHKSKLSLVRHREVGPDVLSFERGAIEALRQDPDIIIVGEMRDPRTIATVLEITDSGHKAFTTLHTSSAIDSIHRIIAEFPPEEQERIRNRLADVLTVTMSQKLVPSIDGKLVMAKEILSVDASVQAAIRNKNIGEIYQMMIEGKRYGMCTLEQDLQELYKRGVITNKTAMNFANNKKRMMQLLTMA